MAEETILEFKLTTEEAEKMILELKRIESEHIEQESAPKDQPIRFRVVMQPTSIGVTDSSSENTLPPELTETAKGRHRVD
jgi:hypothetical protein